MSNFANKHRFLSSKPNISPKERQSLSELKNTPHLVIKKADKGGSIVFMNKEDYTGKVYKHLSNEACYEKLEKDPTKDLLTNINSFIEISVRNHHLDRNIAKYITPNKNPRIPIFYILPKIHKKGIPGRPIVSAVNSITENISEFLNLCIQPLVPRLKSYVKNTRDFVKFIMQQPAQNENILLVSADVTSLYTNIPHNEGICAVLYYMKKFKTDLPEFTPNAGIVKTLFLFILENNYFEFLGELFLQKIGTAMGTKVAPPYASLFLGRFEEQYIFELFPGIITVFLRFLDDIFFIWEHGEQKLREFFEHLNSVHNTIKFTYEFSKTQVNFLDTTVYLTKESRKLKTRLFIKPTDTRSLLHSSSFHPSHTIRSVVYSQALRYRLIITDDKILFDELGELKQTLISRGYECTLINEMFQKALRFTQRELLEPRNKRYFTIKNNHMRRRTKNIKHLLPFIIPYHPKFLQLKQILHSLWDIIQKDDELQYVFPSEPFLVFTRNKNLQDMLIRTKLSN